jgi:hypothetical protein
LRPLTTFSAAGGSIPVIMTPPSLTRVPAAMRHTDTCLWCCPHPLSGNGPGRSKGAGIDWSRKHRTVQVTGPRPTVRLRQSHRTGARCVLVVTKWVARGDHHADLHFRPVFMRVAPHPRRAHWRGPQRKRVYEACREMRKRWTLWLTPRVTRRRSCLYGYHPSG